MPNDMSIEDLLWLVQSRYRDQLPPRPNVPNRVDLLTSDLRLPPMPGPAVLKGTAPQPAPPQPPGYVPRPFGGPLSRIGAPLPPEKGPFMEELSRSVNRAFPDISEVREPVSAIIRGEPVFIREPAEPSYAPVLPPPTAGAPAGRHPEAAPQGAQEIVPPQGAQEIVPPGAGPAVADEAPTGKPWASALEKEFFGRLQKSTSARDRVEKLRGQVNIAEGLDEAGTAMATTAGGIRSGVLPQARQDEFGRRDLAQAEIEAAPENDPTSDISQQARAFLTANGIGVPESVPYSAIVSMMPSVSRHVLGQGALAMDMMAAGKPKDLTPKQIEAIEAVERSIRSWEAIIQDKKGFQTGPFESRAHQFAAIFGIEDPKEAGFHQRVYEQINKYIKDMTGAQLSRHEASRLAKALPKVTDDDDTFEVKAQNTLAELRQILADKMDLLGRQGYDVSGVAAGAASTAAPAAVAQGFNLDDFEIDQP